MRHPPRPRQRPRRRARLARWVGQGLETHVALPLFGVILLAAIWTVTLHAIATDRKTAQAGAREQIREMADTYEAQLRGNLSGVDNTLKVLKYMVELKGAPQAVTELRRQGLLPPGLVFTVAVADRDGKIVASNPPLPRLDVSAAPYFRFHRERKDTGGGEVFVSEPTFDQDRSDAHLHFTRRINDAAGRFAGVALVAIDPDYFTSAYELGRQGRRGVLGLVGTNDGVVRALRCGERVSWGQHLDAATALAETPSPSASLPDHVPRYLGVRRLNGFGLTAVSGIAVDEAMLGHHKRSQAWLAAAASASVLLALAIGLVSAWSWQLVKERRRVRRAQETYAAASAASTDAFFVLRAVRDEAGVVCDFVIEDTNERAAELAGMPSAKLRGQRTCEMLPGARQNGIFEALKRVASEGGVDQAEWQASSTRMQGRWLQRQVVPVEGGVVAILRDITERKLAEQRIFHMAHHDALTGLPNRTVIRERLEQAVHRAQAHDSSLAVVFIDLDGFKLVNDGLGHSAGDELLRTVGARMQGCLRQRETLGRFGGDEFVILLPDPAGDPLTLTPLLERVRLAVTEPVPVAGQAVQVSCSMGVALFPRDGRDADTLMMNADAAMYRAKELGSNNFQFYARDMNASFEDKLVLLKGLRKALDEIDTDPYGISQFRLLYQPKVDLASGRVFGVEALIRWQHPDQGMIAPQRFIGLAEESGLIVQIGAWVLRTACRQAQAWRAAGLPPITMSVNVSARQFEEALLVERVREALRASGLDPRALELEVTESLLMRDLPKAVARMRELKAMDVSLSIDDFGTGYSSLSALKSFPISRLKIDKSFVSELADNPDDQAIALAVISLGHRLNLRVIAEGVETDEQRAFLRENDCDEMQGYLFSPPVPAERIAELLAHQALEPVKEPE
jgi:diguanylate cyclase (GGDEF)-like protein/PAS domain S-box-containing protein